MRDFYEIQLQGHLEVSWSDWFEGTTVECHDDGTTRLLAAVPDQAALHGLLGKVRDLGIPLLLVRRLSDLDS